MNKSTDNGIGATLKSWAVKTVRGSLDFLASKTSEFARDSHRKPDEIGKSLFYRLGFEFLVAASGLTFTIWMLGPSIQSQLSAWNSYRFTIPLEANRWMATFDGESCNQPSCSGTLSESELWSGRHHLSDIDFQRLTKNAAGKDFLIGVQLTSDEVTRAYETQSPVLELGYFSAGYKIFVNGELALSGAGNDILPVNVQLPLSVLKTGGPIRVMIRVTHNLGSQFPVWFAGRMAGLMTFDSARAYSGYWLLRYHFRPLTLAAVPLLLALLFFFLWVSVPRKLEYFYFSLYLLAFSLNQFMSFAPTAYGTPRSTLYIVNYWLAIMEGLSVALIGAAYARTRKTYLFWILGVAGLISVAGFWGAPNAADLYLVKDALLKYYVPTMFFIGGFFCLAQHFYLRKQLPKLMNILSWRARKLRLFAFGAMFVFYGIVFFAQNYTLLSAAPHSFERLIQLTLIAIIGVFLFSEYRDREKQFELLQRSPFHDPFGGPSPEIRGFLLSLDLIKSSLIANHIAARQIEQRPITTWNSMVGQLLSTFNGFKVADEGDGLKIFFQAENTPEEIRKILSAITEIYQATLALNSHFIHTGVLPENISLRFRAGIVWGGIHPIWKRFRGFQTAEFEDAVGATTFKDVQRVMDQEKELKWTEGTTSVAIFATDLDLQAIAPDLQVSRLRLKVKDIGETELFALELSDTSGEMAVA